ncbi:MAG: thiamine-phosphate kinase, partial [Nitrosopumilaceae archaeon]|nr:thiamine-phosphate kinase [Nitrosopumilaceae archaeon]NIP09530.1 thiamine-phosphate kinase [Nitrosopumilaceae archaeon]NIS95459.1 thiamine-phosphate kinase [Nitrosopumilaceae archaeon]
MNKLDESEIIKKFQTVFGTRNFISEDVESFKLGTKTAIAKVDTLVG